MSALEQLKYAYGTEVDYFADWCEANLRHSEDQWDGLPVVWEGWQRAFFEELLAADESGTPYWSSAALVVSRKNGKTAMLAALALYRLMEDEGRPEILLAAASDKQAGRLFDAVVNYLRKNPDLDARVHRREYVGEIVNIETGGKIIRVPSSGETLDGFNPSLAICDELHAWTTPTRRRVWTSLNTGGAARLRTQVVTITTAGDARERETSILGRMIDGNERSGDLDTSQAGLSVSRHHEARTLVFNYSAPTTDPSDVAAMQLANPASWVTDEFLSRQAANSDLTDAEVLQLHGCVWADSVGAWIDAGLWQLGFEGGATIPVGAKVAVGVDVGINHDSTAVVVAWRCDEDDRVLVGDCRIWDPREIGKVRISDVEDHLRALGDRYEVTGVLYDPRFFERSAEDLSEEGLTMIEMQQNSSDMGDAYQAFYASVAEGRIRHGGDPNLSAHVLATAAEKTDRGWKVRKLRQSQRIDACVAAVMACWGAETLATSEPFFGVAFV